MNDLRRIAAILLFLALIGFLAMFGPMLLAFAIARRGEGRHPVLWLLGLVALTFYGLKRLGTPRATSHTLLLPSRIV